MKVTHVNHIGIIVADIAAAKTFFTDLGFVLDGEITLKEKWVERVVGLDDVHTDNVMLRAPDGKISIELTQFHSPVDPKGVQVQPANTLGIRHLAFEVDDVDELVANLQQKGYELVGALETYEDIWRLCYIRGPEEIIIELAERL